jgi:hypothetical protein
MSEDTEQIGHRDTEAQSKCYLCVSVALWLINSVLSVFSASPVS